MILTEADARTKWCPFSRYAYANGAAGNREMEGYPPAIDATRCLGPGCMAWRWRDLLAEWQKAENKIEPANGEPQQEPPNFPLVGFCGLAGTP